MTTVIQTSRIPSRRQYGEPIGQALDLLPGRIRQRLHHVQFQCGVDPVFAGIHPYVDSGDGRPYKETAHCCYPHHLLGPADRRVTTIVLPEPRNPMSIVHELGHALDEVAGFTHRAEPVTNYAHTNRSEAFAEAFVAWLYHYGDQDVAQRDRPTLALFEEMKA